jgi:phthalate 4,5-dioxygenase oxygenase subunit
MLSRENNEALTRVGPGTPMGHLMRCYWLPAFLSTELPEPDCPPIQVKLLGEKLVAFRDTAGRVGLLEEFCAHRCASLFLGRNEEGGLRCIYHGWKYDVDGNCIDMMNEPPESDFKSKIHLKAYPVVEIGGIVWAYLGPPEKKPALPTFEWTQVPASHRFVQKAWEECNWLQALEGGIDEIHSAILHRAINPNTTELGGFRGIRREVGHGMTHDMEPTDYGVMSGSFRKMSDGKVWVRVTHFVMPFHTSFAAEIYDLKTEGAVELRPFITGHIFVPMDDEHCMTYNWIAKVGNEPLSTAEIEENEAAKGRGPGELIMPTFRKLRNKDKNWMIDRRAQKTETFTGIVGNHNQDHAVQESMGPIVDRSKEHLAKSDRFIILARKCLMEAATAVKDGGEPPGVRPTYYKVRATERILEAEDAKHWQKTMRDLYNPSAAHVS